MKDKRFWFILAGIVVVAAAAFVVFRGVQNEANQKVEDADVVVGNAGSNGNDLQTGNQTRTGGLQTACGVYTEAMAKEVIGKDAVPQATAVNTQVSDADVSLTNCTYINSVDNTLVSTAMIQAGKTAAGKERNRVAFEDYRTQTLQATTTAQSTRVSGLGDDAYYNPDMGQLHILVGDGTYWVIAQVRRDRVANQTLEYKLARLLVEKL